MTSLVIPPVVAGAQAKFQSPTLAELHQVCGALGLTPRQMAMALRLLADWQRPSTTAHEAARVAATAAGFELLDEQVLEHDWSREVD
jgi:hypothetical protein